MKRRHAWWASLVVGTGVVPGAVAQPPLPAPPGAAGAAVAVAPAAAPPQTLWSFLGCSWEQKEECRRHLCTLQCGQMLNNATAPLGAVTGGLVPSFCPQTPTAAQLADQGAVGAAAKIKADEAAAKERRAAVRYLGTVDCHYWPEAQDALIAALRSDRNECVRYEAAMAFVNGCCCTKATIEALTIVISCSDRDGFPKETSPRVHAASRMALERCLSCYQEPPKPPPPVIEGPEQRKAPPPPVSPEQRRSDNTKTDEPRKLTAERPVGRVYYARIMEQPLDAVVREGRRVLLTTHSTMLPGSSGASLAKLIDQASGVAEVRGYVVHDGTAASNVVVAEKPTNLWDMLVHNNRPVMLTKSPAPGMAETVVRLTPQVSTPTVVQANVRPTPATPQPATLSMPPAIAATTVTPRGVNSPIRTEVDRPAMALQAPPSPPVTVTPRPAMPPAPAVTSGPALPPAQVQAKSVQAKPPAPAITPASLDKPAAPVVKPVQNVTPAAPKPKTPPVMSDRERVAALNGLDFRQATPAMGNQLLQLAQVDKCDEVRCAAIRAVVRTNVTAEQAIPVLAELGMWTDTAVGKCANDALAKINQRAAGGSK